MLNEIAIQAELMHSEEDELVIIWWKIIAAAYVKMGALR